MGTRLIPFALLCCFLAVATAFAWVDPAANRIVATRELGSMDRPDDHPVQPDRGARGDTVDFGFYEVRGDGLKYAVRGGTWTWDHGAADPLEGWTSVDLTADLSVYWRLHDPGDLGRGGQSPPLAGDARCRHGALRSPQG